MTIACTAITYEDMSPKDKRYMLIHDIPFEEYMADQDDYFICRMFQNYYHIDDRDDEIYGKYGENVCIEAAQDYLDEQVTYEMENSTRYRNIGL